MSGQPPPATTGSPPSALPAPSPPSGPSNPPSSSTPAPSTDPSYRPLNVKNALTYLDQVKNQFHSSPDIYNRFLDIMKDFKAQTIDTPGVIARVSELFKGHPQLILGFNTFLPPGYKIEPGPGASDPVKVSTPTGLTYIGGQAVPNQPHHEEQPVAGFNAPPPAQPYPFRPPPPQQNISNAAPPLKPAVEFNHAITYVNKIKHRYVNEPDTYKQFLEILQTYQREQRHIQEVYAQVQQLFRGAPDLLEEFKQFLPDNSQQAPTFLGSPAYRPPGGAPMALGTMSNGVAVPQMRAGHLPPVGSFESMNQGAGRGRGGPVAFPTAGMKPKPAPYPKGRGMPPHVPPMPPGGPLKKKPFKPVGIAPMLPMNAGLPLQIPLAKTVHVPVAGNASHEELEFFDRVKKSLPKPVYNEFLKLLNLFSQEIIDNRTLVERAEPFLSRSTDLWDWLKRLVKYDEDGIQNAPASRPDLDLKTCRRSGHSYRQLPPSYELPKTSGRDDLCNEVLNNAWVSHPIFMSEDPGFQAHKKNQYEEALHKVEDERYEFDLNIEANLATIAVLEPIAVKLAGMSSDEKAKYRLEPGLGLESKSIHQRIIKKIYDKERGMEVLDALYNNPAVAVPIVLKRLKQKDEEWRRAQREWNKVWRELDSKNYHKSLDHQGVIFRAMDKKALNPKNLVQEIETRYAEQKAMQMIKTAQNGLRNGNSDGPGAHGEFGGVNDKYQYSFPFKDPKIFEDVQNILLWLANRMLSGQEEEDFTKFVTNVIPTLFHFTKAANKTVHQSSGDAEVTDADRIKEDAMEVDAATVPRGAAPSPSTGRKNRRKRSWYQFYANNNWYAFFRLFGSLYHRLMKMKERAAVLAREPPLVEGLNKVAVSLHYQDEAQARMMDEKLGQDRYELLLRLIEAFFSQLYEDQTKYQKASNDFEDAVRELFGIHAYLMFTLDKVAQTLAKQIQVIMSDNESQQLLVLYEEDRKLDRWSARQESKYSMAVENILKDQHLYRIQYHIHDHLLTLEMRGAEELADEPSRPLEERWANYVNRYVSLTATEVQLSKPQTRPFLRRNLPVHIPEVPLERVAAHSGLELKIEYGSFHITFVANTEDYFAKLGKKPSEEELARARVARNRRFKQWLVKSSNVTAPEEEEFEHLLLGQGKHARSTKTSKSEGQGMTKFVTH